MTTKPTDEDVNDQGQENQVDDFQGESAEDDPMIAEAIAAEKEIAELEAQKANLENEAGEEAPEKGGEAQAEAKDKPEAKSGQEQNSGDKPIMVPKGRLDQALSERDLLRNQVGYLQGIIDANKAVKPAESTKETKHGSSADNQEGSSQVDEIDAAIDSLEQKKLELAEKYDEGDISTKDLRAEEIKIDKEIRKLADKREVTRLDELRQATASQTQSALSAQQTEQWINEQAVSIQKNHPNVSVIDATPEHVRAGIWNQITAQAAQNLAQQGIDVKVNTPQVRVMLMQEKARLTDSYTAESLAAFLPKDFKGSGAQPQQQANGQTDTGQKNQMSDKAQNLAAKLDLAQNQPPNISGMGNGADTGELTEEQIANMTEDQMADMLEKAPQLVQRALGNSAI